MAQISRQDGSHGVGSGLASFSQRAKDAMRWWAEHQAWPAIDDIRIDDTKRG